MQWFTPSSAAAAQPTAAASVGPRRLPRNREHGRPRPNILERSVIRGVGARCAVLLLVILAGAPSAWAAMPERSMDVPDVIVDTDVDFDDVAALAYLVEAHRLGLIRLRAVTVAISG